MTIQPYGQYCPVAKACEILEPRWTLLILQELSCGATRFNEIRRGIPGISPTLLARRLRELEGHGLLTRVEDRAAGTVDYLRTPRAAALDPVIHAMGAWAHTNLETEVTLGTLNARALMWNLRRSIDASVLPRRRTVIRLHFIDAPAKGDRMCWLIVRPGEPVDLCLNDPGFEVDLFIEAELRAFTSYWLGHTGLDHERDADRIRFTGSPALERSFGRWLRRGPYAPAGDDLAAGAS